MLESRDEIKENLLLTLCDPEMPFPKMRKEGIGMFCNSSFQFFLVDRRLGLEEPYMEECFEDLKNFIEAYQETSSYDQLTAITDDDRKMAIFHRVRYTPDLISHVNY